MQINLKMACDCSCDGGIKNYHAWKPLTPWNVFVNVKLHIYIHTHIYTEKQSSPWLMGTVPCRKEQQVSNTKHAWTLLYLLYIYIDTHTHTLGNPQCVQMWNATTTAKRTWCCLIAFQTQKKVQSLQDQHRTLSGGDPPGFSITQVNGNLATTDIDKFSSRATVSVSLADCERQSVVFSVSWTDLMSSSQLCLLLVEHDYELQSIVFTVSWTWLWAPVSCVYG